MSSSDTLTEGHNFIRPDYIQAFDINLLSWDEMNTIKEDLNFKILKLINCSNVSEIFIKLYQKGFAGVLRESSHFFVLILEIEEPPRILDQDDLSIIMPLVGFKRPLVLQVSSGVMSDIYVKEANCSTFYLIESSTGNSESSMSPVCFKDDYNMRYLMKSLEFQTFGQRNKNLLSAQLNINEKRYRSAVMRNSLCIRFLKLFEGIHFNTISHEFDILTVLKSQEVQNLLALLEFPFEFDSSFIPNNEQWQKLNFVSLQNHNILMMALQLENIEAFKLLLKYSDINHVDENGRTVIELAWDLKMFGCVQLLIEADSHFPKEYNLKAIPLVERKKIEEFIEDLSSFHRDIKAGSIKRVHDWTNHHPHVRCAYDAHNKSALTYALEASQFKIFCLLKSAGFSQGIDKNFENILYSLDYFQSGVDSHIFEILSKTKINFLTGNRSDCYRFIRKMFHALNDVSEVTPILKIAASIDQLEIVFDFSKNHSTERFSKRNVKNQLRLHSGGKIIVATKDSVDNFNEISGYLAYELAHLVMLTIYGNVCYPMSLGCNESSYRNKFDLVCKTTKTVCEQFPELENHLISTVFCYDVSQWHHELLAQIPQLLITFQGDQLIEYIGRFHSLFGFYINTTMVHINQHLIRLNQIQLIREINTRCKLLAKIVERKFKTKILVKIRVGTENKIQIIASNAPVLTLSMINEYLSNYFDDKLLKQYHILVSIDSLKNVAIVEKIKAAFKSDLQPMLIISCENKTKENYNTILVFLENLDPKLFNRIILVTSEKEALQMKRSLFEICSTIREISMKWDQLKKSSQEKLLENLVNFQGNRIPLNRLVDLESPVMSIIQINDLIERKLFSFGEILKKSNHEDFLQMTLKFSREKCSFENALAKAKHDNIRIISAVSGAGKSVALYQEAKRKMEEQNDHWVSLINLKHLVKKNFDIEKDTFQRFEDFFAKVFIKKTIDREVFLQLFKLGKTHILFDGFDEINPQFRSVILKIFQSFEVGQGNQLWVATNEYLINDLENALGVYHHNIDQLIYDSPYKPFGFYHYDSSLLRQISAQSKKKSNFIGIPLLFRMITKINQQTIPGKLLFNLNRNFNIYKIFEEYLTTSLRVANLANTDRTMVIEQNKMIHVHQNLALQLFLDDHATLYKRICFEENIFSNEVISKVGIIDFNDGHPSFVNRSFLMFFMARFFLFYFTRAFCENSTNISELFVSFLRDENLELFRSFFNEALEDHKIKINAQERILHFNQKLLGATDILTKLKKEKLYALEVFIYSIVNVHNLYEMLNYVVDDSSRTLFQEIIRIDPYLTVEIIVYRIQKKLNIHQQKNLIQHCAISETKYISHSSSDLILPDPQSENRMMNILHFASQNSDQRVVKIVLDWIKKVMSENEIKDLFLGSLANSESFIHILFGEHNQEIVKLFIEELLNCVFSVKNQKLIVIEKGTNGRNIISYVAQNENIVWPIIMDWLNSLMSIKEIKALLKHRDNKGNSFISLLPHDYHNNIEFVILNGRLDIYRVASVAQNKSHFECLDNINNLLTESELQDILIRNYSDQKSSSSTELAYIINVMEDRICSKSLTESEKAAGIDEHRNVFRNAVCNNDVTCFAKTLDIIEECLNKNEIEELFIQQNTSGANFLHDAMRYRSFSFVISIVDLLENFLSRQLLKILIKSRDSDGRNIFHLSALNDDRQLLPALINKVIEITNVDVVENMLCEKFIKGENCLHVASWSRNQDKITPLLDSLKELTSIECQKFLVTELDSQKNTLLHRTTKNNHVCLSNVFEYLEQILSNEEIKGLVTQSNFEGETFFHVCLRWRYVPDMKICFWILEKYFNCDERKDFLRLKYKKGMNIFSAASENKLNEVSTSMCYCLKNSLSDDEINWLKQEHAHSQVS